MQEKTDLEIKRVLLANTLSYIEEPKPRENEIIEKCKGKLNKDQLSFTDCVACDRLGNFSWYLGIRGSQKVLHKI